MSNHVIAALILAGGKSSRMGQDKALIQWEGKPFLTRICEVAACCCSSVYVLTSWPERYENIVSESVQFLVESSPDSPGPIVALADGLTHIDAEWVLLLACDLPQLQPSILKDWMSQLPDISESILAVVPRQESGWEPLCGFYRRKALIDLQNFINMGGRSFQIWLSEVPVHPLKLEPRLLLMLFNCNTPQDLQDLKNL
ncbi:MAG: molybdenum cofactor guanylyltransferase [Cyanobacteriota bacterium]|nr:molybdenum cofactor guanylyltransferase [Cyanobacteriota bacterium]